MAERTITLQASFVMEQCKTCGIRYFVPVELIEDCRHDPNHSWYCPNGHQWHFSEGEADRLRRERDRLKQDNARLEELRLSACRHLEEETTARKKVERELKRTQTRLGAGICPCCNRQFSQLARHMQSKHPDVPFVPAKKARDG